MVTVPKLATFSQVTFHLQTHLAVFRLCLTAGMARGEILYILVGADDIVVAGTAATTVITRVHNAV